MILDYHLTRDDYKNFLRFAHGWVGLGLSGTKRSGGKIRFWRWMALWILCVGVLLLFAQIDIEFGLIENRKSFLVGLSLAAVLVFVFYLYLLYYQYRIYPLEGGAMLSPRKLILTEEGVSTESEHTTSLTRWASILAFEETSDHFFLMIDRCLGHIVPKRTFTDEFELTQFREFIQSHLDQV